MQLIHSMKSILCDYHALPPQGKETAVFVLDIPQEGHGWFPDLPLHGTEVQMKCTKRFADELPRLRGYFR